MTPEERAARLAEMEARRTDRDVRIVERLAGAIAAKLDIPSPTADPEVVAAIVQLRDATDLTNDLLRQLLSEFRKKA